MTSRLGRPASLLGAAAAFLLVATPAAAQESEEPDNDDRGYTVTLGAGAQFSPEYPGADSLRFYPVPSIGVRRQGDPLTFEAPDEGWGLGVLGEMTSSISDPPSSSRPSDGKGMSAPRSATSTTHFRSRRLRPRAMVSPNFRLRVEGRKGLDGHEGWVGDLSADFVLRDRDTYVFSIGPRARWSDNDYHDAYFSVTPAVAVATGLPAFDAGGGFYAVGIVTGLTYKLDRHWGLYGWAGYDRLIEDAADSPIVRAFGSRDQFSAGFAIIYEFDIADPF